MFGMALRLPLTTHGRARRPGLSLGLAAALMGVAGCHHPDFHAQYRDMRPSMISGDWQDASAKLEGSKEKVYGEADRVMFWLNMGTVLHYASDYQQSQSNLVKAEDAMQALWTKSISGEIEKFTISESIQDYPGEDFEEVLLYLYTALNQVKLGKLKDAIVEARRADERLKKMQVYYEKEGNGGTLYRQDAFMLWLVGLFYEMDGTGGLNDAFLAYKAAYNSYQEEYRKNFGVGAPRYVGEDIVRTAKLLGFQDEAERFARETGASGDTADKLAQGMGEVVLIQASGEAPYKEEYSITAPMPDKYILRVALPKFVSVPDQIAYAVASAEGQEARTEHAEPITTIVMKNFEHRKTAIQLRAVARATAKYVASKAAERAVGGGKDSSEGRKIAGVLVGLATDIAGAAVEAADTRSWTTLPAGVNVARLWLPAGHHQVQVTYHGPSGARLGRTDVIQVDLNAGEHKIVSVRSML